jgi:hypothetical protein
LPDDAAASSSAIAHERLAAPGEIITPPVEARKWPSTAIVRMALEVLAQHGRPMKLSALFDAVTARGVIIGGKNPRNNFGAMLSADKVRLTTGKEGWWFTEEFYPRRLDGDEYDEGLAMETARPCLANGAAHNSA